MCQCLCSLTHFCQATTRIQTVDDVVNILTTIPRLCDIWLIVHFISCSLCSLCYFLQNDRWYYQKLTRQTINTCSQAACPANQFYSITGCIHIVILISPVDADEVWIICFVWEATDVTRENVLAFETDRYVLHKWSQCWKKVHIHINSFLWILLTKERPSLSVDIFSLVMMSGICYYLHYDVSICLASPIHIHFTSDQ